MREVSTGQLSRTNDLSETLRIQFALSDLGAIADQVAEHQTVHDAAIAAANELVAEHIGVVEELPNQDTVRALRALQDVAPVEDHDRELPTRKQIVQAYVAPTHGRQGVSRTEISRGALKFLHTDKDTSGRGVDTYRKLEEARATNDPVRSQGLYATTAATKAITTPKRSAPDLELTRYKAWIAMQAGEGRFKSLAEVEAWKANEQALAPHRLRAGLLQNSLGILFATLERAADGQGVNLPAHCAETFGLGLKKAGLAISKVFDKDVTLEGLTNSDLKKFDAELSALLQDIGELVAYPPATQGWNPSTSNTLSYVATRLPYVARALQGYVPKPVKYDMMSKPQTKLGLLGSIALSGVAYSKEQPIYNKTDEYKFNRPSTYENYEDYIGRDPYRHWSY